MLAAPSDALPDRPGSRLAARWAPRWNIVTATTSFLLLAAAIRVWAAVWDQGLVWPDEVFQTMEQAHRFAFGKGVIPWEFRDGARSWVYPGLIGLGWKAAAALGVRRAITLVRLAKLSMATLSFAGALVGVMLARRLAGARAAFLAAVFAALCPPLLVFGSRCTTETASAPLVVFAAFLLEVRPGARRAAGAGALVALAVLFRYQNGLLAVGFLLGLLVRRRWRHALPYVAGALPVAAMGAAVDWLTWGKPFAPFFVYMKFNTTGGADRWGVAPFAFFGDHLALTIGLAYGLLCLGFGFAVRRSPTLVLVVLLFVVAHSMVPHKELRFITPVLSLAVCLAAVGLADLMDGLHRGARPTYVLALVMGAQMAWVLRAPTLGDLGYGSDDEVVWHANEDYFRAGLMAAEAPDLCGIAYLDTARAWSGGYTYLHRDVPVFYDADPRNLAASNYAVGGTEEKLPPAWKRIALFGKHGLYHRDGACGPVPKDWTLDVL